MTPSSVDLTIAPDSGSSRPSRRSIPSAWLVSLRYRRPRCTSAISASRSGLRRARQASTVDLTVCSGASAIADSSSSSMTSSPAAPTATDALSAEIDPESTAVASSSDRAIASPSSVADRFRRADEPVSFASHSAVSRAPVPMKAPVASAAYVSRPTCASMRDCASFRRRSSQRSTDGSQWSVDTFANTSAATEAAVTASASSISITLANVCSIVKRSGEISSRISHARSWCADCWQRSDQRFRQASTSASVVCEKSR